ncbi:hypothetical protein ROHU_021056 [Labeo rohita]|uniref:PARP catalytic domain-containing protein n=1 Tax=Labeo rohita TaxID=84645 RepID=A0A498MPN4_LABRO|nr:hypothetical protein ROHU_006806 [Labeo rohita]RXN26122.1 hypothetical protein ROHU_021056 [Labeo rohita]
MEVDKYILTEALSAILGVTVKLQSDLNGLDGVIQLHITSLTTLAFLGYEEFALVVQPVLHLTFLLTRLFVGEEQKSQETQTSESASSSLRKKIFAIPDDFFDPKFDFDFTNMSESKSDKCARGGEPYKRPYGWMRFALKVRNKYPDGNAWLGTRGWRSRSVPGEWPVSYHGTGLQGAEGIVQSHFKAGDRRAYGRGIYSTPDISVAEAYATSKKFTSQKNGKTYKVIMQSRVNPQKRKIIKGKNYWLVPIPEGTSAEKEKEIVESSIRPYGLLLKEV